MLKADKFTILPVSSLPVMIKSLIASKIESLANVVVVEVLSLMLDETDECCVLDPRASGCFRLAVTLVLVLVTGLVPPLSTDLDPLIVWEGDDGEEVTFGDWVGPLFSPLFLCVFSDASFRVEAEPFSAKILSKFVESSLWMLLRETSVDCSIKPMGAS